MNMMENNKNKVQLSEVTYIHSAKQSCKSKLIQTYMRMMNFKKNNGKSIAKGLAGQKKKTEPPALLLKELEVSSWKVEGRDTFRFAAKQNQSKKHILFLHGGAYVFGAGNFHWKFIQKLINDLNCTVILPDYPLVGSSADDPLASSITYENILTMVSSVYKKLVNEVGSENLIVIGDSAGGGLSLSLALKMKDENVPQPDQIIMLSPWLDITCSNPDFSKVQKDDPILEPKGLQNAAKFYAGDSDPNNYLVSPINGNLEGLGKMSLFIGTHDSFLPDCRKLKAICESKGIKINYFEYPKMFHVWMLVGFLPEAKIAVKQIEKLINSVA